jgi:hypothetical protein
MSRLALLTASVFERTAKSLLRMADQIRQPPSADDPAAGPRGFSAHDSVRALDQMRGQIMASAGLPGDGLARLDASAVQKLAQHAVLAPSASDLALLLAAGSKFEAIGIHNLSIGAEHKPNQGGQHLLAALIEAALLNRSHGTGPYRADELERTFEQWVCEPQACESQALRGIAQLIGESMKSEAAAEQVRLGMALACCGPIALWRHLEGLPADAKRLCGWPDEFEQTGQVQRA